MNQCFIDLDYIINKGNGCIYLYQCHVHNLMLELSGVQIHRIAFTL